MSEPETAALSGEIVKRPAEVATTPPVADMRHEDDTVTRVFVRIEYADGRIREYQAQEPQDFKLRESMAAARGGPWWLPMTAGIPALNLSFTAHPRWNLHIRTEATAPGDFPGITYG